MLCLFVFRIIQKRFLGSMFNFHYAFLFILKGLILPLSMGVNIAMLLNPDDNTKFHCKIMRVSAAVDIFQTAIMTVTNIIFRYVLISQ